MSYLRWIVRIILYAMLAAVISNGCTTINIIHERLQKLHYIDSNLKELAEKFKKEAVAHKRVVDLSELTMIFGTTYSKDEPYTIGTCGQMNGFPVITIDTRYWDTADQYEKEELVFHELGHCILGRDHCEIKVDGKSASIMEPDMLGSVMYKENRENLLNELFRPIEGCRQISTDIDGVHMRLYSE